MSSNQEKIKDPEHKELWASSLESGEYPQTRRVLRNDFGFCCLGVACDLAVKSNVPINVEKGFRDYRYDEGKTLLPWSVVTWLGLSSSDPQVFFDVEGFSELVASNEGLKKIVAGRVSHGFDFVRLSYLNDVGVPFETIAKIIRVCF